MGKSCDKVIGSVEHFVMLDGKKIDKDWNWLVSESIYAHLCLFLPTSRQSWPSSSGTVMSPLPLVAAPS